MKKLFTVLLLSAVSYSLSSSAKDVQNTNCDPCAVYSQEDCATQEGCGWNEEYQYCAYNYTGDVGGEEGGDVGEGAGEEVGIGIGKDSKVGAKYWGRPWGGPWGRPWGGPWGGPWGRPWGGPWGNPWFNHVHTPYCIH